MKKIKVLLFMLAMVFPMQHIQAADLSAEQIRFRNQIMSFLREEGFSPYIDESDESVTFKKEGTLYWVFVEEERAPFYIEVHRAGLNIEDISSNLANAACNHGNSSVRWAKAYKGSSSISYTVEYFAYDIDMFKKNFYRNISELNLIQEKVTDYINNH